LSLFGARERGVEARKLVTQMTCIKYAGQNAQN
jgi:hypothetical protein